MISSDVLTKTYHRFARVVLAGALGATVLLAPPALARAAGDESTQENVETAAFPPAGTTGLDETESRALPDVLGAQDVARYREIFTLQEDGHWHAADRLIRKLDDDTLMGHVLFQRYMHPTQYRSEYLELKEWMGEYADHPGATRIYKLALKRRPHNYKYPVRPRNVDLADLEAEDTPDDTRNETTRNEPKRAYRSAAQRSKIRRIQRRIKYRVQRGYVTRSLEYLSRKKFRRLFDDISYAESLGVIARGYYRYHKDKDAMEVAAQARQVASKHAQNAHWWGGLAAWRQKEYGLAARHFSALLDSPYSNDTTKAAGAFWASRAYLVGGWPAMVNPTLKAAAHHRRTFYGLLANRALGRDPNFDWTGPSLTRLELDLLMRVPAARRAVALLQVGEAQRAELELRRFVGHLPPSLTNAMLAFADQAGLADVAYRIGANLERSTGRRFDAAVYPLPRWAPRDGFQLDRALIYAFVRQESRFRPRAKSWAGARGLMQLMPATAGYIAGQRFRGRARKKLYDPSYNLHLGQKYLKYLLADDTVGGNLFQLAAAYNGGPGNLAKWSSKVDYQGDPLLFIESLPSRETRLFIEHVLANLWIYRHRMGQDAPSLNAILAGEWPAYTALDDGRRLADARGSSK